MKQSDLQRLEQYSSLHPEEVLVVRAEVDGEADEVTIFKGFSSSLMRATQFDPDEPVLPSQAKLLTIDRIASPYQPDNPQFIQQGLTWAEMAALLDAEGIES